MSGQLVRIGLVFCCLTAAAFAIAPPFETRNVGDYDFRADQTGYRLPNETVPETYDISLTTRIDQSNFDFLGTVQIKVFVVNTTRQITVHARQLTINEIQLYGETGSSIDLLPWNYNVVTEFLTIPTKSINLEKGKRYRLIIYYTGVLRTDNAGFYRSSYLNVNGTKTWLATTQFETTDARHAFPCYDEPALKANFTIHIQHGAAYKAISNMPERRSINPDRTVTTHFDETPLTSTYLIAFIVSDFEFVDNSPTSKIRHRVFANPKDYQEGRFAVDEGEKILNAIAGYLRVPFSLPKMDQFAIPDFNAGAMENWGLVTYREEYLLYNQSVHLPARKTNIVSIIAHEFGHQWFGNLVSPKWWTYIWLNEGFATLFDHIGTDLVHPEWNIFQKFVVTQFQRALEVDATENTRPMTFYVESPEAVRNLFDDIAYSKSGSVLRMFLHAFTEASFKKGLTYYLNARKFNESVEDDLFAALQRSVDEDKTLKINHTVKEIFSSWSHQKGVPVLVVTRNTNGSITIAQERYLNENPKNPDPTTWWIPYSVASKQSPPIHQTAPIGWLAQNQSSKLLEQTPTVKWYSTDWVLLNQQETGYYRVQYDALNYKLLTHELTAGDFGRFHPISRSQLINDLFDFTKTNRLPDSLFLDLIGYLPKESEYAPWISASNAIAYLRKQLEGTPEYPRFRNLIASLVLLPYGVIGSADSSTDAHFTKYTRNVITNLACEFGVEACLVDTYKTLKNRLATGKFDSQNNRGIIYANGIRKANAAEVNAVWEQFTKSNNSDERREILISLGNINNASVLAQQLNRTLAQNSELQSSDRYVLLNAIAQSSQQGLSLVLSLLSNHMDETIKLVAGYRTLLFNLADRVVTKQQQTQYESLIKTIRQRYPDIIDANSVNKCTANIEKNLKWLTVHQKPIELYLATKPSGASRIFVSSFTLIIAAMFVTSFVQ